VWGSEKAKRCSEKKGGEIGREINGQTGRLDEMRRDVEGIKERERDARYTAALGF